MTESESVALPLGDTPMAPEVGLEPTTDRLTADCSTTELFRKTGAENGARTRDPDLGKVVLYQLSYFRIISNNCFVLTVQR